VADRRNALEKHLGISEDEPTPHLARHRALVEHVGEALNSRDYAAAQAYALLLIAERLTTRTNNVNLANPEDVGSAIAASLEPDLQRIANAIGYIGE
jgi:hypothetical protein